jgi:SAM-dependent methyltransferase
MPDSLRLDNTHTDSLSAVVRWPLTPAHSAFIDRIEHTAEACTVIGWAVDPDTQAPCQVFAFQDGRFIAGQSCHGNARDDVNAALGLPAGTQAGFVLLLPPDTELGTLAILAAGVNSIAEVPRGSAAVHCADPRSDGGAAPAGEMSISGAAPLFAFPKGSPFEGIYSFRRNFDPRQTAGVTAQFLEDAATYHRKYTAHDRWRRLLGDALVRAQVDVRTVRSVLDVGSGSGNTVIPALSLLPHASIVATDISPQLLAILRKQLVEADRARCICVAMDASESHFEEGSFDLVVGGAILHHIMDPADTIAAAVSAVKPGGHVIFFEPFEAGNAILRLLYAEMIERRKELELPDAVVTMCESIGRDLDMRLGRQIGDPALRDLDDKWLFSRSYFEKQRRTLGCSDLRIYPLSQGSSPFSEQLKAHLKLCIEADAEIIPAKAWKMVRRYDALVSANLRSELLVEGSILLRK